MFSARAGDERKRGDERGGGVFVKWVRERERERKRDKIEEGRKRERKR